MIQPYAVVGFLAAVFPITATPGASVALLIQGGRRRALPVILGTVTGLYLHATLAVLGLSAIVMQSSEAFAVVRVVGAVYLIGLFPGQAAEHGRLPPPPETRHGRCAGGPWRPRRHHLDLLVVLRLGHPDHGHAPRSELRVDDRFHQRLADRGEGDGVLAEHGQAPIGQRPEPAGPWLVEQGVAETVAV